MRRHTRPLYGFIWLIGLVACQGPEIETVSHWEPWLERTGNARA